MPAAMRDENLAAVTLDRIPDPACSYRFAETTPVVEHANEQFESLCGLGAGDSLQTLSAELLSNRSEQPTFEKTERLHVTDDHSRQYLLRIIAPTDGQPGHVLCLRQDAAESQQLGADRMASILSHDLRNPLDVAKARLRAGRELGEDRQFDHVEQAHERIERIIQDVLTLSHGEDVVTPDETVEIESLVETAWQTVETNGAVIEIDDDLPTAVVDKARASRLFENLFRNSITHGRQRDNDCQLTVSVERTEAGVAVGDNGPGITAEDPEQIFEPGYSTDEHGTGLGLAIVDRIASLHGWSVEHCPENDGACFEIRGLATE